MPRYLIRLDDASHTMHMQKWQKMERILTEHGVKPLVGVIPANADPAQQYEKPSEQFWSLMRQWQQQGWALCMHGYDHVYSNKNAGVHPVNAYSEFAGLPLEVQQEKIRKAWTIFKQESIETKIFFAPAHSFDWNTLLALESETPIRVISDTLALSHYKRKNFTFIPQQMGRCRPIPFGTVTFCYHPNTMTDAEFSQLAEFLSRHKQRFVSVEAVLKQPAEKGRTLADDVLTYAYFMARRLRRVMQ